MTEKVAALFLGTLLSLSHTLFTLGIVCRSWVFLTLLVFVC